MSTPLHFTEDDILLVLQNTAQALQSAAGEAENAATLFHEPPDAASFGPERRLELADLLCDFLTLHTTNDSATLVEHIAGLPTFADWARVLFANWGKDCIRFRTSGSTGIPQGHAFPLFLLMEEIEASARLLPLRRRVVTVMPAHHIFGMMYGPVLAKYFGIPLLQLPPLPLASFFGALRPGDLVVGFPLFWKGVLQSAAGQQSQKDLRLPSDIAGLTATSPCPPELIRALLNPEVMGKSAPLTTMGEIYGSTETNGIGIRLDGAEYFTLLPIWRSAALADGSPAICRVLPDGTLEAAQRLPDKTFWRDDTHFQVCGRLDTAVQIGGVNVYPSRVADVIRSHPLVRDCAVRLMRPDEGARLKAFIVPTIPLEEAAEAFGRPFRNWLTERLDTASRPKHIRLGETLPATPTGKASDWD